jgi:hypothetical protein
MIFCVIVGGLGTIEGPVIGAIIFFSLQQRLDSHGVWYLVLLGVVAIVSSWVRFNLVAYHQQAQAVRHRIERSGRTWLLLADYAEQTGLDERVVSALHDVAMTGRARRLRYEHAEGLSLQQAQRDLRDLVSAGILEPVGRTRARYYKAGARFPQTALTEARTPIAITSPYPG